MKANMNVVFWGILLIGGGLVALALEMGYLEPFSARTWAMVFAGVAVAALISYVLSGLRQWGCADGRHHPG